MTRRSAISAGSRGGSAAIDPARLTDTERLERPALDANIRARLFELETVRTWERNPQHYGDLLSTSLAGQVLFDYAPLPERARRVLSKLHQVPRLMQAARDNIKDPPGIFIKVGLESLRGTLRFIEADLPRAFGALDDHAPARRSRRRLHRGGAGRSARYIAYLENDLAPRARGRSVSAATSSSRSCGSTKGSRSTPIACSRSPSASCTPRRRSSEPRRASTLERRRIRSPRGRAPRPTILPPDEVVATAQEQLDELKTFIQRQDIVSLPASAEVHVAPTPRFYRWTFASMWTPGPVRDAPAARLLLHHRRRSVWPAERQEEHLRDFNYGALWAISIHEVYPGPLPALPAPAPGLVDAAQVDPVLVDRDGRRLGALRRADDDRGRLPPAGPGVRLGQLAESLIRLCRLIVGIRLHCEDLSVEQGVRFFRDEAYLEEASARREAERGTFDPGYVLYSLGKLMVLKLREDYKAAEGRRVTRCAASTTRCSATAPCRSGCTGI